MLYCPQTSAFFCFYPQTNALFCLLPSCVSDTFHLYTHPFHSVTPPTLINPRKRSLFHQGIIYLIMPKALGDEWEYVERTSPSPDHPASSLPGLASERTEGALLEGLLNELEEEEEEEEEGLPSCPKLSPPLSLSVVQGCPRLRSQSFDDILSSVNSEAGILLSPVRVQSPSRSAMLSFLHSTHGLGSDSEADVEAVVGSQQGLGVVYNHPLVTSSQPNFVELSNLAPQGPGKFDRLKGKFLQRMKRGQKLLTPPQPVSDHDRQQDTGDSEPQVKGQMSQKLLAVGQRFANSQNLFRRMVAGGRSKSSPQPSPVPSEEVEDGRREARERCQSHFITV